MPTNDMPSKSANSYLSSLATKEKFNEQATALREAWQSSFVSVLQKTSLRTAPQGLQDSMLYSLNAGGKRLRPLLALRSSSIAKVKKNIALKIATALECLHTYSLIHDDLPAMDDDDLRRGKPTNHKVFGEDMAILAGDALQTLAFELLALANAPSHVIFYFSECVGASGMVGGQFLDMDFANFAVKNQNTIQKNNLQEQYLLALHKAKTGRLIEASVVLPFLFKVHTDENFSNKNLAKEDVTFQNKIKKQIPKIKKWALDLGLLFQITDDLLDVSGTSQALGKTGGKDAEQNKLTFVSLFGFEEAKIKAEKLTSVLQNQAMSLFVNQVGKPDVFFYYLPHYVLTRNK